MATKKQGKAPKYQYNSSDWNPSKPNLIFVNAKWSYTGNCIIAVRKWDGQSMRPYRAGRPLKLVHPLTILTIEGNEPINLNTSKIYEYLHEKAESGEIYTESFTYNRCPCDGYKVKINELILHANLQENPIKNDLGEVS